MSKRPMSKRPMSKHPMSRRPSHPAIEPHPHGCACCSPFMWQAFPQGPARFDRRKVLGAGAALTALLMGGFGRARLDISREELEAAAAAAAVAAFVAPAAPKRTWPPSHSHSGPADIIYRGANIHTMRPDQPHAEALAVGGGRILAVGSNDEVGALAGKQTQVIDLDGRTMTPGFIDGHGHIASTALLEAFANLAPPPAGPVHSIEELKARLRAYERENDGGRDGWILGAYYDDSLLADGRAPTRADLDEVSTDKPVFIFHASLHVGVANSKALEVAGITADTPNPDGGVIRRWPNTREPNGILEELALSLLMVHMPQASGDDLLALLDKVQDRYAAWGITTTQDGATQPRDYFLLKEAAEKDRLKIDVLAYPFFQHADTIASSDIELGTYYQRLKVAGIKLLLDGSPQAKTAWLTKPYHVAPKDLPDDYCGYPILPDEEVDRLVDFAFEKGWQVYAHCNGDAAGDQLLAATGKAVEKHGLGDRRTTMIHAQTVREDQLDRMVDLGIMPSFFVTHTFYWGDWHRDSVLGPERGARISPVASAVARDMRYTLHNDSPVAPSDCRMLLWSATTRQTRSGQVLGDVQRVSAYDALRGLTCDAAYQYFEDAEKGTLEPGKRADLVVLGDDPLAMDPDKLKDLEILHTVKDGEAIFDDL